MTVSHQLPSASHPPAPPRAPRPASASPRPAAALAGESDWKTYFGWVLGAAALVASVSPAIMTVTGGVAARQAVLYVGISAMVGGCFAVAGLALRVPLVARLVIFAAAPVIAYGGTYAVARVVAKQEVAVQAQVGSELFSVCSAEASAGFSPDDIRSGSAYQAPAQQAFLSCMTHQTRLEGMVVRAKSSLGATFASEVRIVSALMRRPLP